MPHGVMPTYIGRYNSNTVQKIAIYKLEANSEQKCSSDTSAIVSDLEQAGFVPNVTKSRLKPEQVGVWLGLALPLPWI